MEYVYAALLLHKLGKPVDEAGIHKVLQAAGASVDESKIKSLIASLKEVNIDQALKEAAAMPVSAPAHGGAPAEKKKEEPQEEKREEAAAEGLSALFG